MSRRPRARRARIAPALALSLAGVGVGLTACATEGEPRQPAKPPADLRPDMVGVAVSPLFDEDNNGYPDTIPVLVYLWDNRYPLPFWADGAMRFSLHSDDDHLLAEWEVSPDVLEASRRRAPVGAAHVLTLDIRAATTDVRPPTNALLSGVFLGEDGAVAKTMRPLGVQIGG